MSEVLPKDINPDFPLWAVIEDDGSLTIHWDEAHPATSYFNGWTGDMFLKMLLARAEKILEEEG